MVLGQLPTWLFNLAEATLQNDYICDINVNIHTYILCGDTEMYLKQLNMNKLSSYS